jgi:hypothetical protein
MRSGGHIHDEHGNPTYTKRCAGPCRLVKAFSEFHHKRSNTSTGRHSVCKVCTRLLDKGRKRTGYGGRGRR